MNWKSVHCSRCYKGRYVALDLPRPECSSFLCRVGSEERSGVEADTRVQLNAGSARAEVKSTARFGLAGVAPGGRFQVTLISRKPIGHSAASWFYGPQGFGQTRGSFPSANAIRKADRAQALSARGLCDCHEKPFTEDGKCAQEAE